MIPKMKTKMIAAAMVATLSAGPALAEIMIHDAYARSATPTAKTGAAFMSIMNTGTEDDRLIDVRSDIAARVELHTHESDANGVMRMMHVQEGFVIPAGGMHALARGGDHVMFMGLNQGLEQDTTVAVTLVFEKAGEVSVDIPVDLTRKADHTGASHDH